ncbi:MAG: hypothetical protein GX951_01935 [Mollicutes bacterium]|nr:hypothetical protein [Mollicutes bacterium]
MILLLGKNGSGKTHIANGLDKLGLKKSISYTTRDMRLKERNGIDYFFISKEKFMKLIQENFFIEYKRFNDNFYGTPKENLYNSDVIIGDSSINNNIFCAADRVLFVETPIQNRYDGMLKRGDSREVIFNRIHGENAEYLFCKPIEVVFNNHKDDVIKKVYHMINNPSEKEIISFREFIINRLHCYNPFLHSDELLQFLDYEEHLIRKLFVQNKLSYETYEEYILRFLKDNHFCFEKNDDNLTLNFNSGPIRTRMLRYYNER